jgi:hypothetical protein
MCPKRGTTVVLVAVAALIGNACGGEERRPARGPSAAMSTTTTTSAALTTSDSSSVAPSVNASTNATTMNAATPAPAPTPVSTASAVMRLTTARCERQAACNNVGTNRAFADRDACANEIGHDVVAALSSETCPTGVDVINLATCALDLEFEPCGDRPTSAAGPPSCARERLCVPSSSESSPRGRLDR